MTISRRAVAKALLLSSVAGVWIRDASAQNVTYQYDALGRVTKATYPNGVEISYAYDDAGNRTSRTSGVPGAPTGSLSANPTTITSGQSSTLTWTSANATSASIDNGVGSVTPVSGGNVSVSPTSTTTYTLTLNNPWGQQTYQATVTVNSGFNATIDLSTTNGTVDLRSVANANGYNGASNATITFELESGTIIKGNAGAPGGVAIDSGTWPGGYSINLTLRVKNGAGVYGGGGNGGAGANYNQFGGNGGGGGDAIYCRLPMTIIVDSGGYVQAGAGGGGGGCGQLGGWPSFQTYGGGGGGGGFPNGSAGAGASASFSGGSGGAGTLSGGGAGGAGGGGISASGGAGGGAAQSGGNGQNAGGAGAGSGGAAGYAVRKNGHTVGVTNNGTITGTQG